jgi:hypothetical protein
MSTKYIRRPFAMGNTANPVVVIPELRGSLLKNASGGFSGLPLPSELAIETEELTTAGGVSVVFSTATTMTQILADIAGTAGLVGFVTAEEVEGCLVLRSTGSGEGAYIRIMPPVSGFDDASAVFGFDVYPHPLATVSAGDLLDAPARPRQQVNPVGTKFIATGEDRVGAAYNRALQMLALNADTLYTWLQRSLARPVGLTINAADHAAYLVTNIDGSIAQLDLSNLAAFDSALADVRLCVGGSIGLSRSSSLREISELYEVTDAELKEIPAQDRIVRIGAVTRGQRTAVLPTFVDETSAPSTPVPDTYRTSVDGGNALGVDRAKHAGVVISEIRQRTTIVCTGATFVTNGVTAGDVATITGAAVSSPFNHDGTYLVETVVSEEELVLRPADTSETCRELNPAAGAFGSVVITSGGEWERSLWVSFYPPIPRMPEGGSFVLVVPVETALGALALADIARGSTRTNNNVAGWAVLNLWRGLTLSGLYQGMAGQNGSGFFGSITHRPLRLDRQAAATTAAGTTARSSTGTSTLDLHTLRLTAAATDRFDTADVGLTILLTTPASVFYADEPWTVVRLIDNSTVELAPPIFRAGYQEADGSTLPITSWSLVEGDAIDLHGAMHVVSPEYFGEGDDAPAEGGYVFSREQRDESSTAPPVPGFFSFLHLERIRLTADGTNITVTAAGPLSADDVLPLSFAPEDTSNIFGESYETKTGALQSSLTFVRLLNGKNAGLYRVKDVKDASVSVDAITVQRLDGTPVVFTAETEVQVCFYNAKVGASVPIHGGPGAAAVFSSAMSLFADAKEPDHAADYGLRLGWRGVGGGIVAYVNDPEFKAYDNGDAGDGPLITAVLHAPADGIDIKTTGADSGATARRASFGFRVRAHTNRHNYALSNPGAAGPLFHSQASFGGYVGQTGSDPALVLVKQDRDEAGDESTQYSKLTPSAALLVGRAGPSSADDLSGPSGRGSALEAAGSIYAYRHTFTAGSNPAWSEGGIYSEDVLGAGRWLYPTVGVYDFGASPYAGTGSFSGWEAPTQLGNAGQVYPPGVADAAVSAELLAPDYAIFNYAHSGIVHIADVSAMVPPIAAPFNRFVGCRFKIDDAAADLDQVEFAIVGSVVSAENRLYLALHSETETIDVDAGQDREFKILGQRWHEAHLNVGEYLFFGTSLGRGSLEDVPLVGLLADEINSAVSRGPLATPSYPELQTVEALSPYSWTGHDGVRIGLASGLSDMPNVDVTSTAYASAITWPEGAHTFVHHGWAEDSFEPRGAFPNFASVAVDQALDAGDPTLDSTYKGSLLVNDVAISFPGSGTAGQLTWSERWGGCLHLNRSSAGPAMQMRVWRPGHSVVFQSHLSLRVTLLVRVHDSKSLTIALRKANGDAVATGDAAVLASTTPQEVVVDLSVLDEAVLHEGAVGSVAADRSAEMLFPTLDIRVENTGGDVYLLEFRVEQLTRPILQDGPLLVAGPILAHAFRHTEAVKGYDTRGPLDADMLTGSGYGLATASLDPILSSDPDSVWDRIGEQEVDGTPGRIRANLSGGGDLWHQMVAPRELFFSRGPASATITLVNGAYDPLFFIYKTCDTTGVDSDIHSENFQLPGRTGFSIPFDPPHGALLTSLALSMSFRPNYYTGDDELHWGIFRALNATGLITLGSSATVKEVLDKATNDTAAGVYVDLWRHNALDTGIVEPQNAEFSEALPLFGYPERLARLPIDLSGVAPPTWRANQVDPTKVPVLTGRGAEVFAGQEHFVRRSWDLLQAVDAAHHQALRVDRRQYTYFITISFWGGPRGTGTLDGSTVYEYSRIPVGVMAEHNDGITLGGTLGDPTVRVAAGYPGEYGGPNNADNMNFPPQAKFRGARLGWITDRAGNGGW